jgi:hypothetical protein
MTPVFTGKIDIQSNGTFIPSLKLVNHSKLGDYLKTLSGNDIELIIRKQKSKRSLNQNSAYWGIVIEMLSECETFGGYTKDEIHDALREKFLGVRNPDTGLIKIRSTTDLNTVEFNEYYAAIQRWATSFCGVDIPDPNEVPLADFK